jgi:hypothetical protein
MSSTVQRTDVHDGLPVPVAPREISGHTLQAASCMHAMAFKKVEHAAAAAATPVTEQYDFVVVGAGISGLSAAWFYKKRFGADKRILIVDALATFGGHAQRNELVVDGRTLLGYGGSESLQSPNANFSATARGLLDDLGVDIGKFEREYFLRDLYPGLGALIADL